ncbi:hypothetical protein FD754_019599 [Muntiacus muntjak]|uniref:Uncharacterized protein n=1 Tax=Muntiacus muntjak TaxID=9888 RepID=A0A5N3V0M2_MUNMU|nr:hypothetical protein FD754_019599 [Muntiacus muntjak]
MYLAALGLNCSMWDLSVAIYGIWFPDKGSNPVHHKHSLSWLTYGRERVHLRSARRLCELCCANRGTFIKVGQHLGALDYLLPEEYTSTLKVLHSQAPQSSMKEVRQVIREDLGKENFMVPKRTLFSKAFLPSPITKLKFSFLKKNYFYFFFPFFNSVQFSGFTTSCEVWG